jgi:hypothetical protein
MLAVQATLLRALKEVLEAATACPTAQLHDVRRLLRVSAAACPSIPWVYVLCITTYETSEHILCRHTVILAPSCRD